MYADMIASVVFGTMFVIVCIIMLIKRIPVLLLNENNSEEVEATIISSKRVRYRTGYSRIVRWRHTYRYTYDGVIYTKVSNVVDFHYNPGVVVQAFCSRKNPKKCVLKTENNIAVIGQVCLLAFLALILGLCCLYGAACALLGIDLGGYYAGMDL